MASCILWGVKNDDCIFNCYTESKIYLIKSKKKQYLGIKINKNYHQTKTNKIKN